jgi:hypothetical protein
MACLSTNLVHAVWTAIVQLCLEAKLNRCYPRGIVFLYANAHIVAMPQMFCCMCAAAEFIRDLSCAVRRAARLRCHERCLEAIRSKECK